MFTRQHYNAIAKALSKVPSDHLTVPERQGFNKAMMALCMLFTEDNARFSSSQFVQACGREDSVIKILRGDT